MQACQIKIGNLAFLYAKYDLCLDGGVEGWRYKVLVCVGGGVKGGRKYKVGLWVVGGAKWGGGG